MVASTLLSQTAKFEFLKDPSILQLESLDYSPFHLISCLIFLFAIIHTLFSYRLHAQARKLDARYKAKHHTHRRPMFIYALYFMSEVEVIFALWAIPLFFVIWRFYDATTALEYINSRDYTEALFVAVILAMASTRPIIHVAETAIRWVARGFGGSLPAWWFVLLTIGPLLGSFITEPAAMALCAFLLAKQFYEYHPSHSLAYGTIGLLFVNVSVGGILTHFASPAVIILSHHWDWSISHMFFGYGWKAIIGILLSNLLYWAYFKKELRHLNLRKEARAIYISHSASLEEEKIPHWITATHIFFMAAIVAVSKYPAIFIAAFLFFIAFHQATRPHQQAIRMARPLMIGLFLAGLIIHGGLQGWWVFALLNDLEPLAVMGVAMALTGFNDNAAISYLATLLPNPTDAFKYAIFTGVVAGGGLTVIANAPNPAGYAILKRYFSDGIKPLHLLLAALPPTVILYIIFYFFGPLFLF